MAENIQTLAIPPGAIPVISSIQGAGTLYTAVAKRRLHVVALAISTLGGTVKGVGTIAVTPENGVGNGTFTCMASGAANQMANVSVGPMDLPTIASVVTTLTGTGTDATFSLIGWEEATEK